MRTVTVIFFFLFLFPERKDCEMLPDGHYTLTFSRNPNERIHVKFNDDNFVQYLENGDSVSANIQSISSCLFKLHYLGQSMIATINHLKQQANKSFRDECIEIQRISRDTIKFRTTYTGNLHVTVDDGYYIKR
jgi:hypothetical protein